MIKKTKKKHGWAIRHDFIFTISFVLVCTIWYKTVINGAYWGIALHAVDEPHNDSYNYCSSDNESEKEDESITSSSLGLILADDNSIMNKDLDRINRKKKSN